MTELDDFDRELIAAGRADRMPAARRTTLVATLGAAGVTAAGGVGLAASRAAGAGAGAKATGAATSGAAVATGKAWSAALVAKWLGIGVVTSALAVGGAQLVLPGTPEPPTTTAAPASLTARPLPAGPAEDAAATPDARPASTTPAAVASPGAALTSTTPAAIPSGVPPASTTRGAVPGPPREPAPRGAAEILATPGATKAGSPTTAPADVTREPADAPTGSAAPAAVAEPPPAASRVPPSLREEAGLIERARAAVVAGQTDQATRALDEHARRFPDGALRDEAAVLRIDILAQRDPAAARTAAASFLATHPASPHAARLRARLR